MSTADLAELYQELILDHNRSPRNCHALAGANRVATGHNPLCGDRVQVYLRVSNNRVEEASFEGAGCAICTASCSLMTESVKGKSISQVRQLHDRFHELLTSSPEHSGHELGKLTALAGVRQFPVRVKCATLAWHTLQAAISNRGSEPVSTEVPEVPA